MEHNEGFNEKEEAGHPNKPEIIRYSKEKKCSYIKNSIKIGSAIIAVFLLGWFGGKSSLSQFVDRKMGFASDFRSKEEVIATALQNISPSLVTISDAGEKLLNKTLEEGNLTGVVVRENGLILTSYSIIKDYEDLYVKISGSSGEPLQGQLIFFNENMDVALVKIEDEQLVPAKFVDPVSVREGTLVLAVGNAVCSEYVGLVTSGIVNSTNGSVYSSTAGKKYRLIQVDSKFSQGNYGGAVVNIDGEVIGICSKALTQRQNDGYYSLIDAQAIKEITNDFFVGMDKLGISGNAIKDTDKDSLEGVYIVNVKSGKAADKAGIKPTDIIVKINGEKVKSPQEIFEAVIGCKEGEKISVTILRDGVETNKDIILK